MISKKEKIAIQIIYEEYKKDKNPKNVYMDTNVLIDRSQGKLSLLDLHALILHGNSEYVGFLDASNSRIVLKPAGISYMENKANRIMLNIAFWIFGISSFIAALYSILAFYLK